MKSINKNYAIILLLSFYFLASILIVLLFDGTGERGSGDSILHYLYSKYALSDPSLFFNHWAKPMFVFFSFPFAQFGIVGIKFFNIIVAAFTLFFTYKTAKELNYKNAIIASIILLFTPLYFILIFSGLTEILFSLFLIYCTYQFVKKKYLLGTIIISFLPFIRSEGLIIIGIFGFFLLIKKEWKIIPYLIFGHVIYSLLGYFYYNDILWVFTKIPYAKLSSTYNSGELFHFANQLFYVVGAPIYLFFVLGIISIIKDYFINHKTLFNETSLLIFGSFLSYFVAHSLFWYLGIFNSMGLKRVLIAVAPLIAIITLIGYNFVTENISNKKYKLKKIVQALVLIIIILFPFSSNKSAINWDKDFRLVKSQKLVMDVAEYLKTNVKNTVYIYSDPYLSELLNINHFDKKIRKGLSLQNFRQLKNNEIIIWDNWFGVIEHGISEEKIRSLPNLKELKNFEIKDGGREIKFILFISK